MGLHKLRRKVQVYPRSAANNLGEVPQKMGAPNPLFQESPRQTKPKKGRFMNFSQGHSGTKIQCESCLFSSGKTPEFTKMGEIHEFFVLALSLVWFAGATPDCFKVLFFWRRNTLGLVPSSHPPSLGYACTLYAPTSPVLKRVPLVVCWCQEVWLQPSGSSR